MTRPTTRDRDYARRLDSLQTARWKQVLDVQRPYRWYLRRLRLGCTLDLGCGIGRNLANLDGAAVGVDHNVDAVEIARSRGYRAYTDTEFFASDHWRSAQFDSILCAHVVEHMAHDDAVALLRRFLPALRPAGRLVLITPQERGHRSDPTHERFVDFAELSRLVTDLSLVEIKRSSFPFPRAVGRAFPYNEFVVIARKDATP
jgi:2-polyprenyl-3-methyl-5-hydroxy-6-metoxy-1,4-benzoquinol methylase